MGFKSIIINLWHIDFFMKRFIQKHLITIAIYIVSLLMVTSVALSFYNKIVMEEALETKEQTAMVLSTVENTFLNIRQMDISGRGYALMQEERFLFWSVEDAINTNTSNFRTLDSLLRVQAYETGPQYKEVKAGFNKYIDLYSQMINHLRNGNIEGYKSILNEDYGKQFFEINDIFLQQLKPFEAQQNKKAEEKYEAAVLSNTIVQLLLLLVGLPTLAFIHIKLMREEKERNKLLLDLRENNKKYVFNDGDTRFRGASMILNSSIENFKKAAEYVDEVSNGNYDVQWKGLTDENIELNKENLAGRLMEMKDKMKKVDEENNRRIWQTEGISNLSEIIRNSEQDLKELAYETTKYLCNKIKAQQAALFVYVYDEDQSEEYLELRAAYAFDRKKYIDKKLELGQGLVGQSYKEKDTIVLTEIPQDYHHIKSGLGDTTPNCIIVVPMKYNDQIQAIIELASFKVLEQHEISFLEKAGEYIASAIATAKNNERTKNMVEQLTTQAEEMRAQEEELRQNMEELEATQEEMRRKERIMERKMESQEE